jgi:MoaA/NifB/PqqE/SkfB family radical SAM enzyme
MNLPRPEPSAGVLAYAEEREARLQSSLVCLANWERYSRAGRQEAEVDYLPVKLDVENVSRCNFACTMCAVSTWPKGRRARDMTLAEFKALIDEQAGLVEIKLNGLGEALMQGDDYFEMIRYARSWRIWVRMTTNASLLHIKDNARKLVESGVNEIDISIDGADAATFQGIRIQSDFGQVAANCALLNGLLREAAKPSAKMWTLVQKANHRKLGDHVKVAAALGFRHLVFSTQLHGWGSDALAERNRAEMVELKEDYLWELVDFGRDLGVRVAFWDVSEKFEAKPGKRCPWPFERAVVTSDLRTVPCCMIGDPDAYEIGKGKSFLKNWSSEEYRAFRQAHLDGDIPQVCKGCYK